MSRRDDPAYPVQDASALQGIGLTKREWFAGQALTAILTTLLADEGSREKIDSDTPRYVAANCAVYADALLAELAKGGDA